MARANGDGQEDPERTDRSDAVVLGCTTLAALPLLLIGVIALLGTSLGTGLSACEIDLDLDLALEPALGVSGQPEGPITAHLASCRQLDFKHVRLQDDDGNVLWSAEASEETRVEDIVLGSAPEGFVDVEPLADEELDPETSYVLWVSYLVPPSTVSTSSSNLEATTGSVAEAETSLPMELQILANSVTFRPADLQTDEIRFEGRSLTPAEFQDAACSDEDDEL